MISGPECATFSDDAHPGMTRFSSLTCRSSILPTVGAARFQEMNTRGSRPNELMPDKRARPRPIGAAEGSTVDNAPVSAVYQRWLAFEDYAKSITPIKRHRRFYANHFVSPSPFP